MKEKKNQQEDYQNTVKDENNLEVPTNKAELTEGEPKLIAPIYWGTVSGNKSLRESFTAGETLNPEQMLGIISPYAKRIKGAPKEKADLKKEKFMIFMERKLIENFLNNVEPGAKCEGLAAIFAVEMDGSNPKHQTVILMPYGQKGDSHKYEILKLDPDGGSSYRVTGAERWDAAAGASVFNVLQKQDGSDDTVPDEEVPEKVKEHFEKKVWKIK